MEPVDWQRRLQAAQTDAERARFDDALATCDEVVKANPDNVDALLSAASLLSSFGFLTGAEQCYRRASALAPNNLRPILGIANVVRDAGNHAECRRLYAALLQRLPDHEVLRRNALLSLEYDPGATNAERLGQAKAWGDWAMARAGGARARPPMRALEGRPLRVGYLSADFCQHTVGLFVKDVLASHDPKRVTAYGYSAGQHVDWVTERIRASCVLRNVSELDDSALANLIREDEIDVLVDLSGHTAGSRLTVFAHRAAPVQASWLGYFATTGLPVTDAVLLDDWHAPPGMEAQFVERIIRLPSGRFCYTPVPFAPPESAVPPCVENGYVTFGCFNNTAKFHAGVYGTWAEILIAVPDSRLILKWRTFQDAALCQKVRDAFRKLGIAEGRIELRGASFHADMLKEYADIDIALDPYPFTGGLTSCEALWMGVPVVTWPQGRVVSRQSYAFLSAIGLPELAAGSGEDYVRIAIELATDKERLQSLRAQMRSTMLASPLCDVNGFAHRLEEALISLAQQVVAHTENREEAK